VPGSSGSGGTAKGDGKGGGNGKAAGRDVGGLSEAYTAARNVETAINRTYGRMRSRQLGAALGASPDAMEGLASISKPERPDLDLPEQNGKLAQERQAVSEMAAMAARAQRLLDQAQAAAGTEASVFAAQASAAASQRSGDARDLTGIGDEHKPSPLLSRTRRVAGDPTINEPQGVVPTIANLDIEKAIAGNRIGTEGAPGTNWMVVDSWYWIGPFPNEGRKNVTKAFGPEQGVDLDATYPGKGGKTLRWQFRQSRSGIVLPPDPQEYAVYYAYAEVTCDRDRDLWIAVGSDDQSTLYLNNQIVWISTSTLKGWQPGEGLRRVHFVKGRNRLLFRLENGWKLLGMSVAISLRDQPQR
jgi:hypothetical protein